MIENAQALGSDSPGRDSIDHSDRPVRAAAAASVDIPPPVRQPDAPPPYPFTGEGRRCDFCHQTGDRVWMFPYRPHCVRTNIGKFQIEGGYWGACVMCRPLVEAHDIRLLVARVMTVGPKREPWLIPDEMYEYHLWYLYAALFHCAMPQGPYLRDKELRHV